MYFPNNFTHFLRYLFFRLAPVLMVLACQSASTQTGSAKPEEDLPRVSDQNDVLLAPQRPEPKPVEKKTDPLNTTIKKYSSGDSIRIDLIKTSKLKMLNRIEEFKGQAFLKGKNKLRLEFSDPVKSIAVLNGKRAWVIEYPPKDIDDKIRISKFNLKSTPGQNQLLITSILTSGNLLKTFKVNKKLDTNGKIRYELIPSETVEEFKSISIVIDDEKHEITELQYFDPIDNETTFKFLTTIFGAKIESSLFDYSAPKGAEVNEF